MGLEKKIPNKLIDLSFPRKNYASLESIEYTVGITMKCL